MNRRSFLAALGLAPASAALPAVTAAMPEVAKPPFDFKDGVASVNVGRISFNELRSADGKMVMRPGSIEIWA